MSSEMEPGPHPPERAQDSGAPAGGGVTAATTRTKYIVDITFSGLCLLVRQTTPQRLLVLLPRVPHEGGAMPEHLMVLGTHRRYRPIGPFERKDQFREYRLKDGDLAFDGWMPAGTADLKLPAEVVDLTEVADGRPPVPGQARLRWLIEAGEICDECVHDEGGRWRFAGKEQAMSTRIAWRIEGETDTPGNQLRFGFKFTAVEGGEQEFAIHPVPELDPDVAGEKVWRAALYLYHAPEEELPSHAGHPSQQGDEDEENHHFAAYYSLFIPNLDFPLPVRVPDDADEDEEAEAGTQPGASGAQQSALGPQQATAAALERAARLAASATSAYHGFHGRLYTCTVATSLDDVTV